MGMQPKLGLWQHFATMLHTYVRSNRNKFIQLKLEDGLMHNTQTCGVALDNTEPHDTRPCADRQWTGSPNCKGTQRWKHHTEDTTK